MKDKYDKFIQNEEDNRYYLIYNNDNKEKDKVSKINIIINYQVKSSNKLFRYYRCKNL